MPALRQPLGGLKSRIILIAAVALAAAAIFDWTRPPPQQASGYLFEHVVIAPYRALLHPVTSHFVRCRYWPTCSAYAADAVHVHGFPKGACLALWRICRCGPWVTYGTFDPVPPRQ